MWKKIKSTLSTPIPGDITAACLTGALLGTFTVLCITLPISRTNDSTLGESIFGNEESLDLQIAIPDQGELRLKVTGENTTVVVQSLKRMLSGSERNPLEELY